MQYIERIQSRVLITRPVSIDPKPTTDSNSASRPPPFVVLENRIG